MFSRNDTVFRYLVYFMSDVELSVLDSDHSGVSTGCSGAPAFFLCYEFGKYMSISLEKSKQG